MSKRIAYNLFPPINANRINPNKNIIVPITPKKFPGLLTKPADEGNSHQI